MNDRDALGAVRRASIWFTRLEDANQSLPELIGGASLAPSGEPAHRTDEFEGA